MARKKRAQNKKIPRKSAQDSFTNQIARLGLNQPGTMGATDYQLTRLTQNYNLLNILYRNSWISKKVIDTVADDMTKNWVDFTADLKPEQTDRIEKIERKTRTREKINEALKWGRLYGGAACIVMIKGQDNLLDPLDIDKIMPGDYKGLLVLDRWSGIYPSHDIIRDMDNPEFGLPEYYEIRDESQDNASVRVHHSRVIRFTGRKLPYWEEQAEMIWGASELEHVFEELAKRDNTSWNIASLVFQANLLVNKVKDIDQMSAATDPAVQEAFYNIKSAQNQMRNNNSMMIIGDDEDVTSMSYSFSGLNDIYESQMLDIAGAAEMPVTKLFGREPAGMSATGESDMQNYYDMISKVQVGQLKPALDKLYPIIFMSELGYVPDDLDYKFNSIQSPTEDKLADIVGKKIDSISKAYNDGIISQKMYMTELHELSFTSNMFSSITDEDIDNADDELNAPLPGGDLGGDDYDNYNISKKEDYRNITKPNDQYSGEKTQSTEMSDEDYYKRYGHSKP